MSGQAKRARAPIQLGVAGLLLLVSSIAIAALGDLRLRTHAFLAFWFLAHAAYAFAAWRVLRGGAPGGAPSGGRARGAGRGAGLALILSVGLGVRFILLPVEPTLSEDVYRYLWDGRLVASGVNPFPHPPADPSLSRFHDDLLGRLNHDDVPTIYPPTAQGLFALAALAGGTPFAWKIVLLAVEALLLLALGALLKRRRFPVERLLLYYWSPLVWVESFGSGHVDLVAAAFLVLTIALSESRRAVAAGVAFGLAIQAKYIPLLLAPHLVHRRSWALLGAAVATTGVLVLPFAGAGLGLLGGLGAYLVRWEFNGSIYPLANALFADGTGVRVLLLVALLAVTVGAALHARTAEAAALVALAAYVLVSPTLHPWYLVPLVALLPLVPSASIMALAALVGLAYLTLPGYAATGAWALPAWVPWVEYGGFAAVALVEERRRYERAAACVTESTPT